MKDNCVYTMDADDILHSGVKGQKHGIRRYQDEEGHLTEEGRIHYGVGDPRQPSSGPNENRINRRYEQNDVDRDYDLYSQQQAMYQEMVRQNKINRYVTIGSSVLGAAATLGGVALLNKRQTERINQHTSNEAKGIKGALGSLSKLITGDKDNPSAPSLIGAINQGFGGIQGFLDTKYNDMDGLFSKNLSDFKQHTTNEANRIIDAQNKRITSNNTNIYNKLDNFFKPIYSKNGIVYNRGGGYTVIENKAHTDKSGNATAESKVVIGKAAGGSSSKKSSK